MINHFLTSRPNIIMNYMPTGFLRAPKISHGPQFKGVWEINKPYCKLLWDITIHNIGAPLSLGWILPNSHQVSSIFDYSVQGSHDVPCLQTYVVSFRKPCKWDRDLKYTGFVPSTVSTGKS